MISPPRAHASVLLVDDEPSFLAAARLALLSEGIPDVRTCSDSRQVSEILCSCRCDVIALDISMPHISGSELLDGIVKDYPEACVIMITAINEVETAVACMKAGAFDYLVKPLRKDTLVNAVKKALSFRDIRREREVLKEYVLRDSVRSPEFFSGIVTRNKGMYNLFQYAEAMARTDLPLLITGETGVGKELLAEAIHRASGRTGRFVPVNIAGLDDAVFSDTLFGHRKGAFTGADHERQGLVDAASGGTLFLDEIGELRHESQVKLLRLLQENSFFQLGSDSPHSSSARIVAATNRSTEELRNSQHFRQDLYFRLQSHSMHIPPLRERRDDLALLVDFFLDNAAKEMGKRKPFYPKELITLLSLHDFPGNVRELRGLIYDALGRHQSGVLSLESFRSKLSAISSPVPSETADAAQLEFPHPLPTLREVQDALFAEALKRAGGNKSIAAQALGITRQTINNHERLTRSTKD